MKVAALGVFVVFCCGDARAAPGDNAYVIQDERGYVPADLPLQPTPRRPWEEETGPVTEPLVRRVVHLRTPFKDAVREENVGFLTGKSVYLSPGHGWTWTGSGWTTQRGTSHGIVEDLANAESVTYFLVEYLLRAGAHVAPVREIDPTEEMVICDNDHGDEYPEICIFEEIGESGMFLDSTLAGYGPQTLPITGQRNPFTVGSNRLLHTSSTPTARFVWTFNVPRSDWYNVYVSFSSYQLRAPDAHYVVTHAMGDTHFRVNQRHKGATWVFLGRFYFVEGLDTSLGSVSLLNDSAFAGEDANVSADAVRLGGGMGLIDRGQGASGRPRWEENCRYHAQFSGAPSSVYDSSTSGDGTDDVSCRSRFASWLHEDGEDAVYFSFHTNAGGGTGTEIYVYWPNSWGTCDGSQATPGSRELADLIQAAVVSDIRTLWDADWADRGRRCAWFGELNPSFNNKMPAALIELIFHDRLSDVEAYREPEFRRISARAIYKGIARYFAQRDGVEPAFLPEPPTGVSVTNIDACSVEVSWSPPDSDPAGGDPPETYLVHVGGYGLSPGAVFDSHGSTSIVLNDLTPGRVYSFKVTALNEGGESLPSRVLTAGISGRPPKSPVLVVQGFGRLDASQLLSRHESSALGNVDRMLISRMNDGSYMLRHGPEIGLYGTAFDACEDRAVSDGVVDLDAYEMVNLVVGRGAGSGSAIDPGVIRELKDFVDEGGHLLVSGSHFVRELAQGSVEEREFLAEVLGAEPGEGSTAYEVDLLEIGEVFLEDGYSETPFYDVKPTDTISPLDGAAVIAEYRPGSAGVAGIEYARAGSGKVLTYAFPLEGIISPEARASLMMDILDNFDIEPDNSEVCEDLWPPDGGLDEELDEALTETGVMMDCQDCPFADSTGCSCSVYRHSAPHSGRLGGLIFLLFLAVLCWRRHAEKSGW